MFENMFYAFVILLIIILVLYAFFYPKTQCIYIDKRNNKVKVLDIKNFTVVLVYILDDGQEVTSPQNWSMFDFIKTFRLWKIL